MPRVDTTPARRTKRDAQRLSHGGGARTAASVRAAAAAKASTSAHGSISAPIVKREPVPTRIPSPKPAHGSPTSWRHPDELQYIRSLRSGGQTWDDMAILRFLVANAFSVPPRSPTATEQWVHIRCADGAQVLLPRSYRLPLLWVAKYQWTSVQLVLTAHSAIRQREWDSAKFEILHIARLCAGLLAKARAQMDEGGAMERGWRCALFDRALHRYWHDWLIMRDEFVRDFFREFGEAEYREDVLKLPWGRWVLKGHKGFTLTNQEVADGITADDFMKGLVVDEKARKFEWNESPEEAEAPPKTPPDVQPASSASRTSTPIGVVSFLVRPHNAFRASSSTSVDQDQQVQPASVVAPAGQAVSPSDIPAPAEDEKSVEPLSTLVQEASISVDRTDYVTEDAAMAVDIPRKTPEAAYPSPPGDDRPEDVSVSAAQTKIGNLAPGCGVIKSSQNENEDTVIQPAEAQHREDSGEDSDHEIEDENEDEAEDDGDDKRMEDVQTTQVLESGPTPLATEESDDLDLDDDLQLLYPEQTTDEQPPTSLSRAESSHGGTPSTRTSPSLSRSTSPIPPLSSARFPVPASDAGEPGPSAMVTQRAAIYDGDPRLVAHLLQSCGALGEEMRALRVEVGQLRAELAGPALRLEERVRRLEGGEAASPLSASAPLSPRALGWVHPLQHLISAEEAEAEMDVDTVSRGGEATQVMTRYVHGHEAGEGEPLPPRSRKFNGGARMQGP
ncbi:hypothetical protein DFH07DRAFT_447380 [Mycena maculata]|uniref:Uncharacterized protein n=1 Tax=Mycena maculata TaxID=230809 RepID=A0AAD7NG75_9AGAR|nr:hypothetical protein DFH07DRAFT_447380 [Mycena maculata]